MKPFKSLSLLIAAASALLFSPSSYAQLIAYDDAGNYRVTANWTNGANQGFGFTPWAIVTNSTAAPQFHGSYIGSANVPPFVTASITNISGTNYTNVWGIYANGSGGVNETAAFRGFANPLGLNTFKLQWGSRGAGSTTVNGGAVHGMSGFSLRTGNATNNAADWGTNARFYIYFLDGFTPSTILVLDGAGSPISLTGTSFSDLGRQNITNALEVELTVGPDGDHYHLVVKDVVRNKTLSTLDSILGGTPGGTLDSVAMFNHECTGDQIYNHMQIAVPNLVPPTFANVQPTNGSIYLDVTTNINVSFEVDSFNSTVASNFVTVTLNGAAQTSLTFNSATPTNQLLVTCAASIAANTFYTYQIIAQDANGNFATNTSTFNTFLPTDLYIDAADYNYTNGLFINSSTPTDAYANLLGTQGVDYFISDPAGTNNIAGYRPGDLPQMLPLNTDATGDPIDHAGLRLGGGTAYNIGFTDIGNWENYTRTITVNTNYNIYARAASVGGGQFEIEKLVNPTATTSNQPLAALGRVIVPASGGSKVYSGQLTPLTDLSGNKVLIPLSGVQTLRCIAITSRAYNLEYLVVVPVVNTNTMRPYISVGSPAPGATGVLLDSPISFTVANRQTTVSNITMSLNGTNVTGSATITSNAVGTTVSYSPPFFLTPNSIQTVVAVITDSTGSKSTNTWAFTTINAANTVIPTAYAQPFNSGTTPGFGITIYKISDAAPTTANLSNAWSELAGQLIDTNGLPYPNLATNPATGSNFYLETNTLTYDTIGVDTGSFTFTNRSPFPYVAVSPTSYNFALQALTYLQLTAGSYHLAVRSDDGFELTAGPTPANTNLVLGLFDAGRANTTPSDVYFTVQTNGLYPMSLFYYQAGFSGNLEVYSISNGVPILINDATNPNSIKAFASLTGPALPVTIGSLTYGGGTVSFSFLTQAGHSHYVEYKTSLLDASWTALQTVAGSGSTANVIDNGANGATRFYRVRTQ